MNAAPRACIRRRLTIGGRVQGVGFRPFVFRLAKTLELSGWVANAHDGVIVEIEGRAECVDNFLKILHTDAPAQARVESIHADNIACAGGSHFSIIEIDGDPKLRKRTELSIPVDLAVCDNCRAELFDDSNRRHRHPFIACCDCGPRWSALAALPWNRANTALAGFAMCPRCNDEYNDSDNRRFHAQNNGCPDCGPQLALWNGGGETLAERDSALSKAVDALRSGAIVAVKGLGGFHLMVDARNADAIARLRERKQRPHKPFAVMFESIDRLAAYCDFDNAERALLTSAEAPIVLLHSCGNLPEIIAPGCLLSPNPRLGAVLAYTPLHLLLLRDAGFPLVATSGNRSGEPICADAHEALQKLGGIADYFLVHDRPILHPIDDSVAQIAASRPMLLRCARGYAPLELAVNDSSRENYVALGGQQKNTVAVCDGNRIRISPHIGDLGSTASENTLRRTVEYLQNISGVRAEKFVCDLHPDYRSSKLAHELIRAPRCVQHHHAHIAAVMCEHELDGEVLGIAWDGSGLGDDGTLWGGEFLLASRARYARIATLRDFALPGGEIAAREPRRVALSLLHELSHGDLQRFADLPLLQAFSGTELVVLQTMLDRNVNCPRSSSIGRLFDAVAALLGLQSVASFEGQAAMAVQFAAERYRGDARPFEFSIDKSNSPYRVDWRFLIEAIVAAIRKNSTVELIAARFHATLAAIVVAMTKDNANLRIVLAGGCFQNRLLLEKTIGALRKIDREVFWSERLPPNDGALAAGQIAVARSGGKCFEAEPASSHESSHNS